TIAQAIQELTAAQAAVGPSRAAAPATLLAESMMKSQALVRWLQAQVGGIVIPNDARTRLAAVAFGGVQFHNAAIVSLLCEPPPNSTSAFALRRRMYESLGRGMWLGRAATDAQLAKYERDVAIPPIGDLIDAVWPLPNNGVRKFHDRYWADLCGLTHT